MRYSLALATLPVIAWACWPARELPVVVKAVEAEGVRAQRMDDESFGRRWSAVPSMPPMIERVTERSEAAVIIPSAVGDTQVRRRPLRTRTSSLDVCARYGMRRVEYSRRGWPYWRCRR